MVIALMKFTKTLNQVDYYMNASINQASYVFLVATVARRGKDG